MKILDLKTRINIEGTTVPLKMQSILGVSIIDVERRYTMTDRFNKAGSC